MMKSSSTKRKSAGLIITCAVILMLFAVFVVKSYLSTRVHVAVSSPLVALAPQAAAASPAAVQLPGMPVPESNEPPPPLPEGSVAPDFTTVDMSGNSVKLSSLRGHVVVLDFWATWCPPCRMAIPGIEKLYNTYKSKGVKVVGMSIDTDSVDKVPAAIKAMHMTYTVSASPNHNLPVAQKYNAEEIPALFIIDQKGVVRWSINGFYYGEELDMSNIINGLLKG